MFYWKIQICYETIFPMYFIYMSKIDSHNLFKKKQSDI